MQGQKIRGDEDCKEQFVGVVRGAEKAIRTHIELVPDVLDPRIADKSDQERGGRLLFFVIPTQHSHHNDVDPTLTTTIWVTKSKFNRFATGRH